MIAEITRACQLYAQHKEKTIAKRKKKVPSSTRTSEDQVAVYFCQYRHLGKICTAFAGELGDGIWDFKDGFWLNQAGLFTKGSDCCTWIPPHRIRFIEKMWVDPSYHEDTAGHPETPGDTPALADLPDPPQSSA